MGENIAWNGIYYLKTEIYLPSMDELHPIRA
jgi:hypothetical protein